MGQIQNLEDLLNFLWRRRWLIIVLTLVGTILAAIYAKSRPDTYEAYAAIQVQGAQVGTEGASGSSAQVLQSIEQRLTTREALLAMIERHGLYTDLPALTLDQKAAFLRAAISFTAIESAGSAAFGQSAQVSAIVITARAGEAEQAARIANDLAQGILDMSSSGQLDRAQDTYTFYLEERDRQTSAINQLESEIAAYRNLHPESLPSNDTARREEMVGLEADMRALDQNLLAILGEQRRLQALSNPRSTETRRLEDLNGQVAVLEEQKSALTARRDQLQSALSLLPEVERVLAGMERQLEQSQTNLTTTIARFTEADTALRLAERQQSERFALLDRAVTPEQPVGSSGKKLFIAGALASLLCALGLGFLLDLMNPVVRTSTQLERQLGLRPVLVIPEIDFGKVAQQSAGQRVMAAAKAAALSSPKMLLGASFIIAGLLSAAQLV